MAANNVGNMPSGEASLSPARKLSQRITRPVNMEEDSVMQTEESAYCEDADMYDSPDNEMEDDAFTKELVNSAHLARV